MGIVLTPRNRIVIGPLDSPILVFETDMIVSINSVTDVDIIGSRLSIDLLTPQVQYEYTRDSAEIFAGPDFDGILSSDGYLMATNKVYTDLRLLPYGTLVWWFIGDTLQYKAYLKDVDRINEQVYKITAISAIGLLDTQKHRGGLYKGISFTTLLADIIGNTIPYTVDSGLTSLQVYGWLPYDSRRENLHQLLFATGVMIGRNPDGDMDFRFLSNQEAIVIPDGQIYQGGSVAYEAPVSAVDITEHSFMELVTDETVTEYDNTDGSETANNTLLVFRNAPLHDLQTTGTLTIVDSGVNWAILTGTGILTGKKYTHSTRILTKYAENADQQREKVKSVTDAYLVNVANSENVAKRIVDYYSSKKTVKTAIVNENRKAGEFITGKDPYMESITGFIASMRSESSSFIKSSINVITDYIPTGGGNNYTRAILYTGSGTIDVQALLADKEDKTFLAVLISGGDGGRSGEDGTSGTNGSSDVTSGTLVKPVEGSGGLGGSPGGGGKVFTVTIDGTNLITLVYSCGEGGQSDREGGATTLGDYSSANGEVTPYGVANIFTGELYGLRGVNSGTSGARGTTTDGESASVTFDGQTWVNGQSGTDAYGGGAEAQGGKGGGAAVGADGGSGTNGTVSHNNRGRYFGIPGVGGDGANALDRVGSATGYGQGGDGGHGGGGGGVGGFYYTPGGISHRGYGVNGSGGKGGKGGRGGPGLIIIYT